MRSIWLAMYHRSVEVLTRKRLLLLLLLSNEDNSASTPALLLHNSANTLSLLPCFFVWMISFDQMTEIIFFISNAGRKEFQENEGR